MNVFSFYAMTTYAAILWIGIVALFIVFGI